MTISSRKSTGSSARKATRTARKPCATSPARALSQRTSAEVEGACVAALAYVYDHETRALARRLAHAQHDHHDLSVATLHVHLDHASCLEVAVLRGAGADVRHFADRVIAERGVRHGQLMLIPVEVASETHAHGDKPSHAHIHAHVREAG